MYYEVYMSVKLAQAPTLDLIAISRSLAFAALTLPLPTYSLP